MAEAVKIRARCLSASLPGHPASQRHNQPITPTTMPCAAVASTCFLSASGNVGRLSNRGTIWCANATVWQAETGGSFRNRCGIDTFHRGNFLSTMDNLHDVQKASSHILSNQDLHRRDIVRHLFPMHSNSHEEKPVHRVQELLPAMTSYPDYDSAWPTSEC